MSLGLWPDQKNILAYEETPGEFESFRPRAVSLWEIESGSHQERFTDRSRIEAFSGDEKQAIVLAAPGDDNSAGSLVLYDLAGWKPVGPKIAIDPLQYCYTMHFLNKDKALAGVINTRPSLNDYANATAELKFWKLPDLSEFWSYGFDRGETPNGIWPIPGQVIAALNDNFSRQQQRPVAPCRAGHPRGSGAF